MSRQRDHLTVAVDSRLVFDKVRRGIAKTIIGTYRALAEARPGWRFIHFYRDGVNENPFADLPNIEPRQVDIKGDRFGWWEKIRLPLGSIATRANVFHAPAGPAPRFPFVPLVTTINDLIPLELHEQDAEVTEWGRRVRQAAKKATIIVTASEHAKTRIVEMFGVSPAKIEVIHWGPISGAGEPIAPERIAETRKRLGIDDDRDYVLHFGMPDPRKNTARTIDAWARLPLEIRRKSLLLIVGVHGPAIPPFRDQVERLGIGDSVRLHSYVSEEDVRAALAGATALCYPTTYEGFGLPILDGFAAKVPVLSGNATSLPEVAGDAAQLVDALNTDAIRDGLLSLLSDATLRGRLIQRGTERLARFTWSGTAERMATIFERAAR